VVTTCATPAKRRYATRRAAVRAAGELMFIADGVVMRAYPCPCGWWHLTRRHSTPMPAELAGERLA
jgi:hypothetical protein